MCSFVRILFIAAFHSLTTETKKSARLVAHANFVQNQAYERSSYSGRSTCPHWERWKLYAHQRSARVKAYSKGMNHSMASLAEVVPGADLGSRTEFNLEV
jgi:hypothetical protein